MEPLVVTAVLDEPAQSRLNALRRRHFPSDRNHLDAHVTLFHALSGELETQVAAALTDAARREPPEAVVGGPRLLGRGVTFRIDAPELLALRADLARTFDPWLTRQDRGKRELHVTVQNKCPRSTPGTSTPRCPASRSSAPPSSRSVCGAIAADPGSRSRPSRSRRDHQELRVEIS